MPAALPVRYRGPGLTLGLPLHFTPSCLPSTILGPGLNLGLCTASTGAQSSQLLTRLFPSTRRVVLPGRPEIPDEPPNVMHRARISEPTERANKSTSVMQRQEGNFFISSALGLKPHLAQRNQTRALKEAVWRLIYSQLFVSVTGYLAIPDWTGRMSSCNAFLMLSRIEIFPCLVKECSSRKQET